MSGAFAILGLALSLQSPQQIRPSSDSARPPRLPPAGRAVAVHADKAPVIDGIDDDAVWRKATVISEFRQWQPTEDKEPRFRTEAKVAYDAANLYVFVRAFDPRPDSIIRILERRDTYTPSDMIWLFVDSFHDRRTGYEFGVNAAGVKIDQAIYDDGNEDVAWDGARRPRISPGFVSRSMGRHHRRRPSGGGAVALREFLPRERGPEFIRQPLTRAGRQAQRPLQLGDLAQLDAQYRGQPVVLELHGLVRRPALHLRASRPGHDIGNGAAQLHVHADVSLQAYVQPFISKGTYTDVRQLSATPRAAGYDQRYAAYGDTSVTNNPGGFNFKEFQSNLVFRWEYQPGSTLFVVWNEGRQGSTSTEGNSDFGGDVRDLMRLHPVNTVLVKMSYWLNW
jgi:hypothetical protein